MSFQAVAILGVSAVVAWCATRGLLRLPRWQIWLDVPNPRSSHAVPTLRIGGIAIIAGACAGAWLAWLFGMEIPHAAILGAFLLIAVTGLADDFLRLPVLVRLIMQCLAAGIVVYHSGGVERLPLPEPLNVSLGALAVPVALIWLVGVTNIYNFLDGMDGFAALQGCIVGLAAAMLDNGGPMAAAGLAISGACLGFLPYNWHPAKVFMGDAGSLTLGFAFATMPFLLDATPRTSAVFSIAICLWFFLADGSYTMFRRLLRGERPWEAHRCHLYQRLLQTGMRHDHVTSTVMSAAAVLAILAVIAYRSERPSLQWCVLGCAVIAFLGYRAWTRRRERR
jgi:Fuc2NAc and GlcNAc transferase